MPSMPSMHIVHSVHSVRTHLAVHVVQLALGVPHQVSQPRRLKVRLKVGPVALLRGGRGRRGRGTGHRRARGTGPHVRGGGGQAGARAGGRGTLAARASGHPCPPVSLPAAPPLAPRTDLLREELEQRVVQLGLAQHLHQVLHRGRESRAGKGQGARVSGQQGRSRACWRPLARVQRRSASPPCAQQGPGSPRSRPGSRHSRHSAAGTAPPHPPPPNRWPGTP